MTPKPVGLDPNLAQAMRVLNNVPIFLSWVVDHTNSKGRRNRRLLCLVQFKREVYCFIAIIEGKEIGDIRRVCRVADITSVDYKVDGSGLELLIRSNVRGEPPYHVKVVHDQRNLPKEANIETFMSTLRELVDEAGGSVEFRSRRHDEALFKKPAELKRGKGYLHPKEKQMAWDQQRAARPPPPPQQQQQQQQQSPPVPVPPAAQAVGEPATAAKEGAPLPPPPQQQQEAPGGALAGVPATPAPQQPYIHAQLVGGSEPQQHTAGAGPASYGQQALPSTAPGPAPAEGGAYAAYPYGSPVMSDGRSPGGYGQQPAAQQQGYPGSSLSPAHRQLGAGGNPPWQGVQQGGASASPRQTTRNSRNLPITITVEVI